MIKSYIIVISFIAAIGFGIGIIERFVI